MELSAIIPSVNNFGGGGPVIEVDKRDQELCNACRVGDLAAAQAALDAGANPAAQFRLALGEITPIFLCASKGYIDIATILIKKRKECVNHKIDFDGTICLHHAASNNQPKMCEFLIKNGCDVNQRDKIGRTPLMDAAEIGSQDVINILIKNNVDINAEDKERYTALSYCMDFISSTEPKYFNCALELVKYGANPNYSGKYARRTLLHCCAAKGDLKLIKQLIEENGASLKVYDAENRMPIQYAQEYQHQDCVEYLQQKLDEENSGCCIIL